MCGHHKMFSNNKPYGSYDQLYGHELALTGDRFKEEGSTGYCEGVYIFVVLPTSNPFAYFTDHMGCAVKVRITKDRTVKHDALARGRDVRFAGTVEFKSGLLIRWCNGSGHYLPDANCCDQAPKAFTFNKYGWVVNDHKKGAFWSWEGEPWYRDFKGDDSYEWTKASDKYLSDRGIT